MKLTAMLAGEGLRCGRNTEGGKSCETDDEEGFWVWFRPADPSLALCLIVGVVNLFAVFGINNHASSKMTSCSPLRLKHTCSHANPTPTTLTRPPFPHTTVSAHIDPEPLLEPQQAASLVWKAFSYTCLNLCCISAATKWPRRERHKSLILTRAGSREMKCEYKSSNYLNKIHSPRSKEIYKQ